MNRFTILQTDADMKWWAQGDKHGWELPPPARWLWRRRPFRSLRWWLQNEDRIDEEIKMSRRGLTPSGFLSWKLYAVRRGWC